MNNLQASIISCQYNEEENLYCLIQHICDQKDSELELIIIDDQSTDQSLNLARAYKNNKKLDIKVFENTLKKGKKHAQKVGFKKARHNNLLLTDIDCIPASDLWAKKMINALVEHDLILGHAPFYKKNQWLNKVQRYDNTWIALQYMGLALRKSPYMGVGRNMAVTKSAYESMKHSIKGHHLKSGDDDLLVQALRFKSIGVQLDPQTFMYSNAESSYSSWLRQKKRQITTSTLYAVQHQVLLTLSAFLSMCTPILLLFNLLLCQDFNAFCLFVGYLIVLYSVKGRIFWKFKENDLIIILPILEILYSIHLLILSIFVLIKKSDAWK